MKILAIETSSIACSVALLIDDRISASHTIMPLQQAHSILPMIKEELDKNNIELKQLDAIAFGCGPGSFTGVRIAVSVTQGLGFALSLPVIPISSLAALAQAAAQDLHWNKLVVAVDARIQEVYYGFYEVESQGLVTLVGKEMVSKPQDIIFPTRGEWYGVGDAWEVYKEQMHFSPLAFDKSRLATAVGVAQLAKAKFMKGDWVNAMDAVPVYLRNDVVKRG